MNDDAEVTASPEVAESSSDEWSAQSVTVEKLVEKHLPGQSYKLDEIKAKLRQGEQIKSLDRGVSRAEIARRLNVSTATLDRWQKAEKDGTLDKPKPRVPRGKGQQKPAAAPAGTTPRPRGSSFIIEFDIVELMAKNPKVAAAVKKTVMDMLG